MKEELQIGVLPAIRLNPWMRGLFWFKFHNYIPCRIYSIKIKTVIFFFRLQTPRNTRLALNEYVKSSTEGAEYAVSNQESKCGGSFLVEALAKVNTSSVTEVT